MEENNLGNKENCSGNKTKAHYVAKFIGILIGISLVFFIGVTAIGIYWPKFQDYRYKMEGERLMKEAETIKKETEEAQKNDTFGGKTPEETFDMFLDALKKSDVELAAKYYDVTVQKEALAGLNKEMTENGNLNLSISYFSDVRKGEKECSFIDTDFGGCSFYFEVEKGTKVTSFKLINFTNIWKITKPF